jgi:hypothetical protein
VVVTFTNVLVKDLTSGATFSIWETFSYTNPWPLYVPLLPSKRSGRDVGAPACCRSASAQGMRMPFYCMDCPAASAPAITIRLCEKSLTRVLGSVTLAMGRASKGAWLKERTVSDAPAHALGKLG